jgi:ATP-dependent exoDNAse (exonuclease V) beta subunit
VHTHFPKFNSDKIIDGMMKKPDWKPGHKYWGLTKADIKKMWSSNGESVSSAGTNLHYAIEQFMNTENVHTHMDIVERMETGSILTIDASVTSTPEWNYFMNFTKDKPMFIPYRTEWLIYDEDLKIAGSIDMVYTNEDGTLSIYDWKRCKSINKINLYNKFALTPCISDMHDTNYWHYTLQLNIYKYILEHKYNQIVSGLYLVQLHPDVEENNYVIHELQNIYEMDELMNDRLKYVKRSYK